MRLMTREDRLHASNVDQPISPASNDKRSPFEHDFDRLIHSDEFRRLAHITQIVNESSSTVFHNRLTHTLKVAQIGRRIAETLLRTEDSLLIGKLGGLSPEVVAAAGLAHDLGHPVFGHIGEERLNALIRSYVDEGDETEGYEGNAQSFRIVTKLAIRSENILGLNLTRATLNAILKYPKFFNPSEKKWGVYRSEQAEFNFARQLFSEGDHRQSLEAAIMDLADDIAYSSHDLEDNWRAGLIPLDRLSGTNDYEAGKFMEVLQYENPELVSIFKDLVKALPIFGPYRGYLSEQTDGHNMTSYLITRYVTAARVNEQAVERNSKVSPLSVPEAIRLEIDCLKKITHHYVINTRSLATQQYGHKHILSHLFETFCISAEGDRTLLPPYIVERLDDEFEVPEKTSRSNKAVIARVVADYIAALTDDQAIRLHRRLIGTEPGSILDHLP